ncbi:MAG: hypothetical protein M1819_005145 [Sarea resinae]|nr:MAG: hypothetical protein M1819_005145 [Sarea resinae]
MADSGSLDPSGNSSLQALFAQLRANQENGTHRQAHSPASSHSQQSLHSSSRAPQPLFPGSLQPHGYHQPTVSSATASPQPHGSQPHNLSIMSPVGPSPAPNTPLPPPGHANVDRSDRTANLLNLLRFHKPGPSPPGSGSTNENGQRAREDSRRQNHEAPQKSSPPNGQLRQRTNSTSDLMASFVGKSSALPAQNTIASSAPQNRPGPSGIKSDSSENPQEFLLRLLNRPKPKSNDTSPRQEYSDLHQTPENHLKENRADASSKRVSTAASNGRVGTVSSRSTSVDSNGLDKETLEPALALSTAASKQNSIFTYVNPFDQLAASSPRNHTPIATDQIAGSATLNMESANVVREPTADADAVHKSESNESSTNPQEIITTEQMASNGHGESSNVASSPLTLPDGRSKLEALMGIGANNKRGQETVSEALNEVGEKVDRQVEEALAQAERDLDEGPKPESGSLYEIETAKDGQTEVEDHIRDAAIDIKAQLDKSENQGALEETLPKPAAEAVEKIIEETAGDALADSWENASAAKDDHVSHNHVFNFPMKPFVSITIESDNDCVSELPHNSVMDIARLKKPFDQVDRTLVTATNKYIVYAMSKNGGFRIIRQEDGKDRQIFRTPQDRIFNVAISTAPSGSSSAGTETVLGTGVSGSVYWSTISKPSQDLFEEDEIESQGIIFPPSSSQDENTSGGQLKTRAKKSSRHPEVIAIGRGKSIHLIYPEVAFSSYRENAKSKIVDSAKYLRERNLKIAAGKAGKDFTFSEDDSLIATLDKAGRLRFWDIRPLLDTGAGALAAIELSPVELREPLMTLITSPPSEKSWPTSVMFVDKHRPFTKGLALRYMIVGLRQNHTLQLWDLGLGKVVQELNFPHEREQDAICSVSYHPSSGIIAVGHPTRNSIYLVHLSAPKYNLPAMSQAQYIQRLAQNPSSLANPEATAIMSGFRELSFASKGELRSVDMLCTPSVPSGSADLENPVLFELYTVHSKGVTCLTIKRADLGWGKDNRVTHPVDAEAKGFISIKELAELPPMIPGDSPAALTGEQKANPAQRASSAMRTTPKDIAKKNASTSSRSKSPQTVEATPMASPLAKVGSRQDAARAVVLNGAGTHGLNKFDKKKKKHHAEREISKATSNESNGSGNIGTPPFSYAHAAQRANPPQSEYQKPSEPSGRQPSEKSGSAASLETGYPKSNVTEQSQSANQENPPTTSGSVDAETYNWEDAISKEVIRLMESLKRDMDLPKVEDAVGKEVTRVIGRELDSLYRRFDDDRRAQDAAGAARHEAVLRLVSSTLSENVERNLARMIQANIQDVVIPSLHGPLLSTLDSFSRIPDLLSSQVSFTLPQELDRALQRQTVQDMIGEKIVARVESEISKLLQDSISPAFKNLTFNAAQKFSGEVNRRVAEQVDRRVAEQVNRFAEQVDRHVSEQFRQIDSRFGQQLREAEVQRFDASNKIDQLTDLVQSLSGTVQSLSGNVQSLSGTVQQSLLDNAQTVQQSLSDNAQTVQQSLSENGQTMQQSLSENGQAVQQSLSETGQTVQQSLSEYGQTVQQSLSENAQSFKQSLSKNTQTFKQLLSENAQIVRQSLLENAQNIAASQSDLQNQLTKLQEQVAGMSLSDRIRGHSRQRSQHAPEQIEAPLTMKTPEDQEIDDIAALLNAGKYEESTIWWLQSPHQDEIFNRLFVRCNPAYLRIVSSLVSLSVSAAVTSTLESHLTERLNWLETILDALDPSDPEIHEVAPQIMDIISQRLEGLYMRIAETNPHDPVLRKIPPLTRRARELKSKSAPR